MRNPAAATMIIDSSRGSLLRPENTVGPGVRAGGVVATGLGDAGTVVGGLGVWVGSKVGVWVGIVAIA
jgi:hypothetical protein